jgi:YD repeat-containing protein
MTPLRLRDINDNLTEVVFDELGRVKAMALLGKGAEADRLDGISTVTNSAERAAIEAYFQEEDSHALTPQARTLLSQATIRYLYQTDRFRVSHLAREQSFIDVPNAPDCRRPALLPTATATIAREQHAAPSGPLQLQFQYSDGDGQTVMVKRQAEPGEALRLSIDTDCAFVVVTENTAGPPGIARLRWVGNGRTVRNNKGNAVKQYEPYFSVTPAFEDARELVERGVTQVLFYDALGRLVRTDYPDGSVSRVEFDVWQQKAYDRNDTLG